MHAEIQQLPTRDHTELPPSEGGPGTIQSFLDGLTTLTVAHTEKKTSILSGEE